MYDNYDLDQLQICAKGKSISEFRSVSKGIRNMQKIATEPKKSEARRDLKGHQRSAT